MQIDLIEALRRLLAINNLQLTLLQPPFEDLHKFDYGLRDALDPHFDWQAMGKALLEATPERTLLVVEDTFGIYYLVFRLPDESGNGYIIGPWRHKISPEKLEQSRAWFRARTSQEIMDQLGNFYDAVFLLENESAFVSAVFAVLSVAYPHTEGQIDFHTELRKEFLPLNFNLDNRMLSVPSFEKEISMSLIEERYQNENDIMDAVTKGDAERAFNLWKQRRRFRYSNNRYFGEIQEKRNGLIIFNVLLRKAIERAQVHPYFIDQLSAQCYSRISTVAPEETDSLSAEMIYNYCRYAREYSMRQYSPLIRKTIHYINANLASSLSLKVLAEQFFISPSYLSNLFKSETGVTLVDYISTCRMKRAAKLLTETNLSITAVAEHVGIVDVNYFAKIFKKAYRMTPTMYRRASREQNACLAPADEKTGK